MQPSLLVECGWPAAAPCRACSAARRSSGSSGSVGSTAGSRLSSSSRSSSHSSIASPSSLQWEAARWRQHWRCRSVNRDLTADLLESVAVLALRARLREARSVTASISCDFWSLLAGRVNGVRITGQGWRSPLNLTAQVLEATVGEATLDPAGVVLRQQIELLNVPVGTARVLFNATDLGNFLTHPLTIEAAATAVQGQGFAFEQSSVRISPPSPAARGGCIEFTGLWRGDGQRYAVRLLPVAQGAAMRRGVQAHAVPLSAGSRSSAARIVEDDLSTWFSNLSLDLQGAELSFMSLTIIAGTGFAALAELNLRLELRKFPPLHLRF